MSKVVFSVNFQRFGLSNGLHNPWDIKMLERFKWKFDLTGNKRSVKNVHGVLMQARKIYSYALALQLMLLPRA